MKTKSTEVLLYFVEGTARRNAGLKIRRKPMAKVHLDAYKFIEMTYPEVFPSTTRSCSLLDRNSSNDGPAASVALKADLDDDETEVVAKHRKYVAARRNRLVVREAGNMLSLTYDSE
jgi:hypothetical protein